MQTSWKSLPSSDDIKVSTLDNGVSLMTRPNADALSVAVMGYLPVGSILEPDEKLGLANFTARALMLGNTQYSMSETYDELESAGASLSISSGVHECWFYGQALAEDLPLLLKHLTLALRQPTFPSDQVEKLRAKLLTSIAIREDDTYQMASLGFDELLFGNHPYGKPATGYAETVNAIQRADLEAFHQSYFTPSGMVLAIVGPESHQAVKDNVTSALVDWRGGVAEKPQAPMPTITPLTGRLRKHVVLTEKSQSDLVMGCFGPNRLSEEYLTASLGNNILGTFGMMGRIGESVREKAGLAYYASSRLSGWQDSGTWEVSAGVNPANLEKAIDLIIEELRRFAAEPVTAEELANSKANMIGQLPLALESNAGVANALINIAKYDLGLDYYRQYPDRLQAITADQILETAKNYLDINKLVISSAGT